MIDTAIRLNLGGGDLRHEGFLTVDLRDDVADVVADVRSLPYEDGEVDEILAEDLLEHFPEDQTMQVLGEWHRVLAPSGRLTVKVPNLWQLARAVMGCEDADSPKLALYVRNIYGGHKYGPEGAWDTHHWGWTPKSLAATLDAAGFDVESNDLDLNMRVVAVKR